MASKTDLIIHLAPYRFLSSLVVDTVVTPLQGVLAYLSGVCQADGLSVSWGL